VKLSASQRVQHKEFGLGTIVEIDAQYAVIEFDEHGRKTFQTSFVSSQLGSEDAPPIPSQGRLPFDSRAKTRPREGPTAGQPAGVLKGAQGCFVLLGLMCLTWLFVPISCRDTIGKIWFGSEYQYPSGGPSETFTINGEQATVTDIYVTGFSEWNCGTVKFGFLEIPGLLLTDRQLVRIYYDRAGGLVSINDTGNRTLIDNMRGRECLFNWKTNRRELLTQEEYLRYEREEK